MRKFVCFVLCAALLAVHPIAFAIDDHPDADFFALLDLELPQLSGVKEAVETGDYTLALTRLLEYYKTRTTPVWYTMPRPPRVNTGYNRTKVDQYLQHQFEFYSLSGCPDIPGTNDINWLYTPNGDPEWYWALNRHFSLKDLTVAYQETSEDKYATEFELQFRDWYADNPVPETMDTSGTWRTIEAGLRLSESMIHYFNNLLYCDAVSDETKLLILKSLYDHGQYLSSFHGGGNWLLFECRGLYALATMFPEFKQASQWENTALTRLEEEYNRQFLQDGWQYELTANYHMEATKSVYQVQEIAAMNGKQIPFAAQLGKSFAIGQKMLLAGSKLNPTNDTSYVAANDFLYQGAAFAQEAAPQDVGGYLYTASEYTSGSGADLTTSSADEIAGNAHFRDYYGPDGIYGYFEAGPSGVGSHGFNSKDKLQFTLSAYDRELLVDPGVYSYAGQDIARYMFTTQAHNTVTIDDMEQVRRTQDVSQEAPGFVFEQGNFLDYAEGVYDETYSETQRVPVTHKRKVLFVKSGYFVIRDELSGQGSHTAKQYWNFAPGDYELDAQTGVVHTKFADANVMILPVDFEGLEEYHGSNDPLRGWCTSGTNVAVPSLNLAYKRTFQDNGVIEAVVIPYQGNQPPRVRVHKAGGQIIVDFGSYQDTVVLEDGDYTTGGSAALVRQTAGQEMQVASVPDQSQVFYNGNALHAETPEPRKQPAVSPLSSNRGMVQAEWTGMVLGGNARYCYNSTVSSRATVQLAEGGALSFGLPEDTQILQIRAQGNSGRLEVWQDGQNVSSLDVNSSGFRAYAVSGLHDGNVQVRCTDGSVELDYFQLSGDDREEISTNVVRQRMANAYSLASFGSAQDSDSTIRAAMKMHSALSADNKGIMGVVLRGNYKLQYDFNSGMLQIGKEDAILAQRSLWLQTGKWYIFEFSVQGTSLEGHVYDKQSGNQVGETVVAQDSTYSSGIGGIFCAYADCSADDVAYNGQTDTFETTRIGSRPNNWVDGGGGLWRVAAYTDDNQLSVYAPAGNCVLEQHPIQLSIQVPDGYTQPVLYCNGEQIADATQPDLTVEAQLGQMQFWLEAQKDGSTVCSPVLTVDVMPDVTPGNTVYAEAFDSYTGGFPSEKYEGTPDKLFAVTQNDSTALELRNTSDYAEIFTTLPAIYTGYVTAEIDVTPKSMTATIPLLIVMDPDGHEAFVLAFEKNGVIQNRVTGQTIGAYLPNQTYHVRVDYKLQEGTFDIYIDGVAVSRNDPLPEALTGARRFYLAKIWSSGSVVIDNAKVCRIDPSQLYPLQIWQGNVLAVATEVYYEAGDIYVGVFDGNRLEQVYGLGDVVQIPENQSRIVKVFQFSDFRPLKSAATYYISETE